MPQMAPEAGIISRTVIQNPSAKWLFPLRFSHRARHDIAFVYETFIEIKSLFPDGRLGHVGTRKNLGSKIRAAAVVGERPKPLPWASRPPYNIQETSSGTGLPTNVPPQFLVFAQDDPPELRFMTAAKQTDFPLTFHEKIIPLPSDGTFLNRPGNLIAVDPQSRAVAVAAIRRNVMVCRLRDLATLSNQYLDDLRTWNPVVESIVLKVDGYIQHMDFLKDGTGHADSIALVLIVAKEQRSRIWCYIWDADEPLVPKHPRILPLDRRYREPQLLIPLQHTTSFLLIYSQHYLLIRGPFDHSLIASEAIRFWPETKLKPEASFYPTVPSNKSTWTSWSQDVCDDSWDIREEERFYLAREDGKVFYFHFEKGNCNYRGLMCDFEASVGKAFTVSEANMELRGPFFLISAGQMSPGKVMSVSPFPSKGDQTPSELFKAVPVYNIENWSPSIDSTFLSTGPYSIDARATRRGSILTTARRGPRHGAIVEHKYGLEAKLRFQVVDDLFAGVTKLWAVPGPDEYMFLVLSLTAETSIIAIHEEDQDAVALDESVCGAQFDDPTIEISLFTDDLMLQITKSSLRLLNTKDSNLSLRMNYEIEESGRLEILYAIPHKLSRSILLVVKMEDELALKILSAGNSESDSTGNISLQEAQTIPLSEEPTASTIFELSQRVYIVLAMQNGTLLVYAANESNQYVLTSKFDPNPGPESLQTTIYESIVVLTFGVEATPRRDGTAMLLCSTRDGRLLLFEFCDHVVPDDRQEVMEGLTYGKDLLSDDPVTFIKLRRHVYLGSTPAVLVRADSHDPSTCFAYCGSTKLRIRLKQHSTAIVEILEIISSSPIHPIKMAEPVTSMSPVLTSRISSDDEKGTIAVITGSTFSVIILDTEARPLPTYMMVQGSPNRVMISDPMSCLVVVSQVVSSDANINDPSSGRNAKWKVASEVQMIGRSEKLDDEGKPDIRAKFAFLPREKIYSIVEVSFTSQDRRRYYCFFIGSGVRQRDGRERGYLTVLAPRTRGDEIDLKVSKRTDFRDPVYSIAQVGAFDVAFTTGRNLRLCRLEMPSRSWREFSSRELRSAGVHISKAPTQSSSTVLILVSTYDDSIVAYSFKEEGQGWLSPAPVLTDSQARPALHHLSMHVPFLEPMNQLENMKQPPFPQRKPTGQLPNVILCTDKAQTVAGLLCRTGTIGTATTLLFEACLPESIVRLRRGSICPPWNAPEETPSGVLVDDLIGTSIEGSVYQFTIVSSQASKVLMILEDLVRFQDWLRLRACGRYGIVFRSKWSMQDFGSRTVGSGRFNGSWAVHGMNARSKRHCDGDLFESLLKDDEAIRTRFSELLALLSEEKLGGPDRETFDTIARAAIGADDSYTSEQLEGKLLAWLQAVLGSAV